MKIIDTIRSFRMLINGCLRENRFFDFIAKLSKLRISSWILVAVTPFISLLIYSSWELFSRNQGCAVMACVGNGMAAIIIPILIYFIAVILAAIFNFVDFIKTRRTAATYRYIELIIFFAIPLAVFSIPYFL